MHTIGTAGDEKEDAIPDNDGPQAVGLNNRSHGCFCFAGHALDHFPCATLTERVVAFLERYNGAIYDFG
jgi:hypothetical protein